MGGGNDLSLRTPYSTADAIGILSRQVNLPNTGGDLLGAAARARVEQLWASANAAGLDAEDYRARSIAEVGHGARGSEIAEIKGELIKGSNSGKVELPVNCAWIGTEWTHERMSPACPPS